MAERRIRDTNDALEVAFEEIRRLKARLNQPRTRLLVGEWTITEADNGDLVFTRPGSPTFTIPS